MAGENPLTVKNLRIGDDVPRGCASEPLLPRATRAQATKTGCAASARRAGKANRPSRAQYHVAPGGQRTLPPRSAQIKR